MSTNWTPEKLGKLVSHRKGFIFKSSDFQPSGHPIVRVSDFTDRSIDVSECNYMAATNAKNYSDYALLEGDVVIATVGSWPTNPASIVGKTICVPSEAEAALLNQNAVRLRALDRLNQRYLFYLLKTQEFQNYIVNKAQGSANQASITLADIFAYDVLLPSKTEQEDIANLLGSLDDKIVLNERMNQALEQLARTIFRNWFLEFGPVQSKFEHRKSNLEASILAQFPDNFDNGGLPTGWHKGVLGDIAKSSFRAVKPSEVPEETPYIGLEHMPKRSISLSRWQQAGMVNSNKTAFEKGDFLFGKLRPYFHKVGIAPLDGICSTDIVVLQPSSEVWSGFVLLCISSDDFVNYTNQGSTGTKMPRTSWKEMAKFPIVIPPENLVIEFDNIVQPMIARIISNIHENKTLARLRDFLAPKFINGAIVFSEARERVEAAL